MAESNRHGEHASKQQQTVCGTLHQETLSNRRSSLQRPLQELACVGKDWVCVSTTITSLTHNQGGTPRPPGVSPRVSSLHGT